MPGISLSLSDRAWFALAKEAAEKGIKVADLIRLILSEHNKKNKEEV